MTVNRPGLIVQTCWMSIPEHNLGVRLDEYVIMPNHLHGIIVVSEVGAAAKDGRNILRPYKEAQAGYRQARAWQAIPGGSRQFASPRQGSIGAIVRTFKATVTREARHILNDNSIVLWQRNYYEHIIRGESEMNAARDYIRNNPANWSNDREHAK
jgi:putative transposase